MTIDKKKYIESIKKLHKAYGFKEDIDSFVKTIYYSDEHATIYEKLINFSKSLVKKEGD